jgi:hypothetical protein
VVSTEKIELKDAEGRVIAKATCQAFRPGGHIDRGIWLELVTDDKSKPTLCLVHSGDGSGWYIGVYADANKPGSGCDLAFSFGKDGPTLQIVKEDKAKTVNLFDVLERLGV